MGIVVRRMTERDAAAVGAVQRACPEAAQWAAEETDGRKVWVVEVDGEVAGFAVWQELPGGEAELLNLAVAERARRQGAGRALVEAMQGRRLWLEVRASNERAIRFYESLGFEKKGLRRNYYRDPAEDAVVMGRD
jgi:ribosomal-protein-alanine N-acetyltransferase